jgi:GAF domain-containing protein
VNAPRDTARTTEVARAFAGLTDALVNEYDVTELLQRLVDHYVSLLDAAAAGLMLTDQRGSLRLAVATDERIEALELLQLRLAEGPCLDCFRQGRPVFGTDLAGDPGRWPRFVPAVLDAGYQAVHALPLRLDGYTLGGMNLFYADRSALSDDQAEVAQALANLATVGILQHHGTRRSTTLTQQLEIVLNARATIGQARGFLAETGDLGSEDALQALRGYARAHGLYLADVARGIVERTLDAREVLGGDAPR